MVGLKMGAENAFLVIVFSEQLPKSVIGHITYVKQVLLGNNIVVKRR
jgi:hypothetical protein